MNLAPKTPERILRLVRIRRFRRIRRLAEIGNAAVAYLRSSRSTVDITALAGFIERRAACL